MAALAPTDHLQKLIFELEVGARDDASPLQERVSRFCQVRLPSVLSGCLAEFAHEDTVFTFDRLELDLGALSIGSLEDEMAHRLALALRDALSRRIAAAWTIRPVARVVADGAREAPPFAAMAAFLERGVLPPDWHAAPARRLDETLLAMLRQRPAERLAWLRILGRKAAVRNQLARQFSEPASHELTRLLAPAYADFVIDFAREVSTIHASRQLLELDASAFGKLLWECIFTHLFLEAVTRFNALAFIGNTLRQLAAGGQTDAQELFERVASDLRALSPMFCTHYSLGAVLKLLPAQRHPQARTLAPGSSDPYTLDLQPTEGTMSLSRRRLQVLATFLDQGVLPWSAGDVAIRGIDAMVAALLDEAPAETQAVVRRLGQHHAVRQRLASQLQDPAIEQLVERLEPSHARSVLHHAAEMRRIQRHAAPVRADGGVFRAAVWQFVLTYLLVERGSHFNTREFVRSMLVQMAARYGLTYGELLLRVVDGFRMTHANAAADDPLGGILISLSDEIQVGAAAPVPSPGVLIRDTFAHAYTELDLLAHWLRWGSAPAWRRAAGDELDVLLQWLRDISDAELEQALRRARAAPHAAWRIVRQLPATLFPRAVQVLAGAQASRVFELQEGLRALAERGELAAGADDDVAVRVREYVLAHLLANADQPLALSDLVRGVLGAIAIRYDTGYCQLLAALGKRTVDSGLRSVYAALDRERSAQRATESAGLRAASARVAGAAPGTFSPADAVIELLSTGVVSPQAAPLLSTASRQWFTEALRHHAGQLLPALKAIADRPDVIQRLLHYVEPTDLSQLVEELVPAHAPFVFIYLQAGARLETDPGLASGQRRRVAAVHWQAVLTLLLDAHAPSFSGEAFLAQANSRVAQRLNLPLPAYRAHLLIVARHAARSDSRYGPLAEILAAEQGDDAAPAEAPDALTSRLRRATTHELPGKGPSPAAPPGHSDLLASTRHFLRFGSLPTPATVGALDALAERLPRAFQDRPAAFARLFRKACESDLERLRIARTFPPALFAQLLRLLLPEQHQAAALGAEALSQALTALVPGVQREALRAAAAADLLRSVHEQRGRHFELAQYLRSAVRRIAEEQGIEPVSLLEKARPIVGRTATTDGGQLLRALDRLRRQLDLPGVTATVPQRDRPHESPWLHPAREREREELPAGESFYVANAGLVLVWPFLSRYFGMLGLLEQDAFADERQRSRAVYLLQHLATGKAEALEPSLLLNKILCGMDSAAPPEPAPVLTEQERHASEELLHAVTQNWAKLRNTSVAGLRDSFLIREGRLLRKDDAWALTVEIKAHDVLLDTLPWRLSTIRLPWMQCVLYVSWR